MSLSDGDLVHDDQRLPESLTGLLVEEAARQLTVCNACRYCEGLCAVFPALTRRATVESSDVTQLANLCHDCRACYDACMYSPPHEFDIDLPKVLSAIRVVDYDRLVWPRQVPRPFSGKAGVLLSFTGVAAILLAVAVAHAGWDGLISTHTQAASVYALIPYPVLLAIMLSATMFCVGVMINAGFTYWRELGELGPEDQEPHSGRRAIWTAIVQAVTLRYLRGGGEECYYPEEDKPSPSRRWLHSLLAGGFMLCFVATVAAAVSQDILGIDPPYAWLSVPVLAGVLGGIGMTIGCAGLLYEKAKQSEVASFYGMTVKDYGLLVALLLLAVSGLAVLLTRGTSAFGLVLLFHLAAVTEAIALAPYSKFVHIVFRFAALVRDNLEQMVA